MLPRGPGNAQHGCRTMPGNRPQSGLGCYVQNTRCLAAIFREPGLTILRDVQLPRVLKPGGRPILQTYRHRDPHSANLSTPRPYNKTPVQRKAPRHNIKSFQGVLVHRSRPKSRALTSASDHTSTSQCIASSPLSSCSHSFLASQRHNVLVPKAATATM
jgi:hypothetical protein